MKTSHWGHKLYTIHRMQIQTSKQYLDTGNTKLIAKQLREKISAEEKRVFTGELNLELDQQTVRCLV